MRRVVASAQPAADLAASAVRDVDRALRDAEAAAASAWLLERFDREWARIQPPWEVGGGTVYVQPMIALKRDTPLPECLPCDDAAGWPHPLLIFDGNQPDRYVLSWLDDRRFLAAAYAAVNRTPPWVLARRKHGSHVRAQRHISPGQGELW